MLLKEKQEIEKWLEKYDIQNYELFEDKVYGYIVNVNSSVLLNNKKLKKIEVKFNIVYGDFYCYNNELKSLVGCPEIVDGSFYCSSNKLKSLEGCPKIINENFYCDNNKLKTLEFSPKVVDGNFYCNENELTSLIGCPEIIEGSFNCSNNKLNIEELKKIINVEMKSNYIQLSNNKNLGEFQKIDDFNELKKILNIYQEKADLIKILEVTDKSVESTDKSVENLDLLINNKTSNAIIKKVEKITKI